MVLGMFIVNVRQLELAAVSFLHLPSFFKIWQITPSDEFVCERATAYQMYSLHLMCMFL